MRVVEPPVSRLNSRLTPWSRISAWVLPPLVTAVCLAWLLASGQWDMWGVETMPLLAEGRTSFGDLLYVTSAADCMRNGTSIEGCDPYGRVFQPYVVLPAQILAWLGWGVDQTQILGIALALAYVVVVGVLAALLVRSWRGPEWGVLAASVTVAAAAVSAPAILMVERGQPETIVLACVIAALVLLTKQAPLGRAAGALAGFLAVVLKYFPIGMFLPFLRRGRVNWWALVGLLLSLLWLIMMLPDARQATEASGADSPVTTRGAFGSATVFTTLLADFPLSYEPSEMGINSWGMWRAIGLACVCVVAGVVFLVVQRSSLDIALAPWTLITGGVGVIAVPLALGVSHDYRLVFLLLVLVGSLTWWSACARRHALGPALLSSATLVALATGAPMVTTAWGFAWPQAALVLGDVCVLAAVGAGLGLWLAGAWSTEGRPVRV